MTRLHLLTLALVASLSLPSIAQADDLFGIAPRAESVDIGSVFHNTDNANGGSVDISDVFHHTDDDLPITLFPIDKSVTSQDIGLVVPGKGGVGTVKVGAGKATQTAATRDQVLVTLDCAVAGTPAEFPDDLRITNAGPTTIPVGTQIKWRIKSPRLSGAAVLSAPLKAGKTVRIDGVLAGGLEAGTACSVKAIGL